MAIELEMIEFKDFQEPAVGAENLNKMQQNIKKAINDSASSGDGILTGSVIGYTGDTIPEGYEEIDGLTNIETITNDNGTAIKFPDGTMICRGELLVEGNSDYKVLTFPQPFISSNYTPTFTNRIANSGFIIWNAFDLNPENIKVYPRDAVTKNFPTSNSLVYWTAIGRWK